MSQQLQGAWVDTRVSVVTVPVSGPITAHITGKVSPNYGVFLGGTYAPETPINSPVAMEKGSDFFERRTLREKSLTLELPQRRKESPTLQITCCDKLIFSYNLLVDRAVLLRPPSEEDPQKFSTFTRSTENKIHFPSPPEEPSTKQRGDSRLNISPPL